MDIEITTQLELNGTVIARDVTVQINAQFSEIINASGDHCFELDDYDIMGIHWESELTGIEARVEYPSADPRRSNPNYELERKHRQYALKMLENLRTFIPLTDAEIEAELLASYSKVR